MAEVSDEGGRAHGVEDTDDPEGHQHQAAGPHTQDDGAGAGRQRGDDRGGRDPEAGAQVGGRGSGPRGVEHVPSQGPVPTSLPGAPPPPPGGAAKLATAPDPGHLRFGRAGATAWPGPPRPEAGRPVTLTGRHHREGGTPPWPTTRLPASRASRPISSTRNPERPSTGWWRPSASRSASACRGRTARSTTPRWRWSETAW